MGLSRFCLTEQNKPKPVFVTKFLSQTVEDERLSKGSS